MSKAILLSITVETYNQEKLIKKTLDCILAQDYWFPYEIIIGDDCSCDTTPDILDEYASKYSQIKVIHNEKNLGAMGNFYNLLSFCKGKYLMDCAGDDFWVVGKVKKQIQFMEAHPEIGLCYGKAYTCDENEKSLGRIIGRKSTSFEDLLISNGVPILTFCARLDLINTYLKKIQPQSKNWSMEDYPLLLWMSKESNIYFMNEILGCYRILNESLSHSTNLEKSLSFEKNVYEIKKYFADLYNYSIESFDEHNCKKIILYKSLLSRYEKNLKNEFISLIQTQEKVSIKDRIRLLIVSSSFTIFLYKIIKKPV